MIYFVHIPDSNAPTAEVEAPDTRHARTVYLDFLSRKGIIPYSQRGAVRKAIKTNRMEAGEYQTSIRLSYSDVGKEKEEEEVVMEQAPQYNSSDQYPDQYQDQEQSETTTAPLPGLRSPLAELSLRMGGL